MKTAFKFPYKARIVIRYHDADDPIELVRFQRLIVASDINCWTRDRDTPGIISVERYSHLPWRNAERST